MLTLLLHNFAVIEIDNPVHVTLSACNGRLNIERLTVLKSSDMYLVLCCMLTDDSEYVLSCDDKRISFRTRTKLTSCGPLEITRDHLPFIQKIAASVPGEFLVTSDWDVGFWNELLSFSFFTLPMTGQKLVLLPCPDERYCVIDLADGPERSRKSKRFDDQFDIRVNHDFKHSLETAAEWHRLHNGTWLSPFCVKNLLALSESQYSTIRMVSFEAWEKSSGKLAAVSLGYSCGLNFHDFTACTIIRDKRSIGTILLHKQRQLLVSAGCQLWYLGFKIPYMKILNGSELDSGTFFDKWNDGRKHGNFFFDELVGRI